MRFVDQCRLKVVAGDGGNGAAAFRREKFVPFGGPSGGDGGRGGDVVFVGAEGMSTLLDFTYMRTIEADRGEHGQGSDCHGRAGADRVVQIPVGTQIRDAETGELLADITAHEQRIVLARGGRGGRGNIHFATPFDRAPRRAEKGEAGERRELLLELKVLADVGLLGFPNVGKSTFVSAVSAARPKIADYPFTTLTPTLGMVGLGGGPGAGGTNFVIADIPGLVPGASEGVGLGIQFLKHVERTRVLLHLVTLDHGEGREPLADYRAIREELKKFSPELSERPEIVALSKADLPEVREAYPELKRRFERAGIQLRLVSAATREGVAEIVAALAEQIVKVPLPRSSSAEASLAAPREPLGEEGSAETSSAAPTKPARKTNSTKKSSAKKGSAKKSSAKKSSAKKSSAKKRSAKKRSAAPAKPARKTSSAKKSSAKKSSAKKSSAKKRTAAPAKPARKTSSKKSSVKKRTAAPAKPARRQGAAKVPASTARQASKPSR